MNFMLKSFKYSCLLLILQSCEDSCHRIARDRINEEIFFTIKNINKYGKITYYRSKNVDQSYGISTYDRLCEVAEIGDSLIKKRGSLEINLIKHSAPDSILIIPYYCGNELIIVKDGQPRVDKRY